MGGRRTRVFESTRIGGGSTTTRSLDFPGVEIDVVAAVVFVSADIEGDFDRIAFRKAVGERGLFFHALELDRLRILSVFHLDDEFPLRESTREGLHFTDHLDGAFQFKTLAHTRND